MFQSMELRGVEPLTFSMPLSNVCTHRAYAEEVSAVAITAVPISYQLKKQGIRTRFLFIIILLL